MSACQECGKPLGSNKDCDACLEFIIEMGAEEMDEEAGKRTETDARKWLEGRGKSAPEKLFKTVQLLVSMIRDYFTRDYTQMPWGTVAMVAFTLAYVINPFDLVPDFIPGIGWVDDIAVAMLVLKGIERDLKRYCTWKGLNPEDYGFATPTEKSRE